MLTKNQVSQIKEHLEKAQNPIFFFDNDADGLCSFLILRKFCEKGKGVQVKSYPSMNKEYFRKVNELKADYIFIVDKPLVDKDFFDEADKINIPVVWIDHHEVQVEIPDFVHYYNPVLNKTKTNEPVTHLCYQISGRKDDLWLDIVGCTSDKFFSENYLQFKKTFPELVVDSQEPFDILYKSQIGKVAKILSFALKDTTSNVVNMLKFLIKAKGPYDILEEKSENRAIHKRFSQMDKRYAKLLDKAKAVEKKSGKNLFFQYSGDMSISGELSNELCYNFPEKVILIARVNGPTATFSARGKGIRGIISKAMENIPDSRSGGHENAVGGQMKSEDLEKFRENLENRKI
ncbi:MAG: DHH family phosphoesterase [Nanoarchaeota archaeon]